MGLPWNVNASMGGAGVNDQILRSLRFRSSASAYLNRTPASATNQTTWTWSAWVKLGSIATGSNQAIFGAGNGGVGNYLQIYFDGSSQALSVTAQNSSSVVLNKISTAVYRDPSAWYHVLVAYDSTQATSTNRIKIYVNGVQITSFSTNIDPALNTTTLINSTNQHTLSSLNYSSRINYFDGYMAEVNFIDGQQLTPASFGYNDPVTGVWQPAPFKGTYGTNGFYLPFTDIATTSGSNFGLGRDYSGNSNYWNTNNISVTSGTTYDSMIDSPTNFSDGSTYYNRGNYATLNPVSTSSLITSQNGNLNASTNQTASTSYRINSTFGVSSGKWYCELTNTSGASTTMIGVGQGYITNKYPGEDSVSWAYHTSGLLYNNGSTTSTTSASSAGDIVGVAFDVDAGKIWFSVNGTYVGSGNPSAGTNPAFTGLSGTLTQMVRPYGANNADINFGQRPFSYTPPTGFKALNTFNLPTPTIPNGAAYMNATLWTGDNTANRVIAGLNYTPDFIWIKNRNSTWDNILGNYVAVNGSGQPITLVSNSTAAQVDGGYIGTQTTNSIKLAASAGENRTNGSGLTYVGWSWLAGGGGGSSNTSGSITSTVSANTTAGFSVVSGFTVPFSGSCTIGHGLGVAPSMIIVKSRTGAYGWTVYHVSTGNTGYLVLNTTAAFATSATVWNNTSPTSTIFTLGSDFQNTGSQVAYCFAAVRGYSAFGSYTGNGSTDGPFVYTGFRPRFILLKNASAASTVWLIFDTSRNTYNVANLTLQPESSAAEVTSGGWDIDILSNGFKPRNSGTSSDNGSGNTIIYAAFAENPFQYARAR